MPLTRQDVERNFTYHRPTAGQPEKYERLRGEARRLALLIFDLCPESRERSIALTEVESAVMWANAAIARNQPATPVTYHWISNDDPLQISSFELADTAPGDCEGPRDGG